MIARLLALAMALPLAAQAATAAGGSAAADDLLHVCASPNNLPFSNRAEEGFENQLARMLAAELGKAGVKYTWWVQRRGFIRETLEQGRCDVVMGWPASSDQVLVTSPYYRSTYALVYRSNAGYELKSLDDPRLQELAVGLNFIGDDYHNTPPAQALALRGVVENVVGYSLYGDYRKPNPPARVIEAVADKSIDVAVVWGPRAGYFAARQPVPLTVVPIAGEDGLPFEFSIALAVRKTDTRLHQRLNQILKRKRGQIHDLLAGYHVPLLPFTTGQESFTHLVRDVRRENRP